MKMIKNENALDRFLRVLVSELLFIIGYFWVGGWMVIIVYALVIISLFTAITGFCALYKIFNFNTTKYIFKVTKIKIVLAVLILIVTGVLGSYFSIFFTKKFFLEDYNNVNNYYKQTLFYTGQENKEDSVKNYYNLVAEYQLFLNRYKNYSPFAIRSDKNFNTDIIKVSDMIIAISAQIEQGDLLGAHTKLEGIRPIFQDILKRNNFSMLAVALVDFHDSMEKIIIAADDKYSASLFAIYPEVDGKLKDIEEIVNDEGIQEIRKKLDEVYELAKNAQNEKLSAKAAELKSSFIKVYLERG